MVNTVNIRFFLTQFSISPGFFEYIVNDKYRSSVLKIFGFQKREFLIFKEFSGLLFEYNVNIQILKKKIVFFEYFFNSPSCEIAGSLVN